MILVIPSPANGEENGETSRNSMVFYRSFCEVLSDLPPEDQAPLWKAIWQFGLDGTEPTLPPELLGFFRLIRPTLEKNRRLSLNGKQPKRKQIEAEDKQTESKAKANRSKSRALYDADADADAKKNTSPSVDGGGPFELFWRDYPRKEAKKDAMKAWSKLKGDNHVSSILACLSKADFSPDPKFIPLPATWLNREPWKFDIPSASSTGSPEQKKGGGAKYPEPEGWQEWFRGEYEREAEPWDGLNEHLQAAICREMAKRKKGGAA